MSCESAGVDDKGGADIERRLAGRGTRMIGHPRARFSFFWIMGKGCSKEGLYLPVPREKGSDREGVVKTQHQVQLDHGEAMITSIISDSICHGRRIREREERTVVFVSRYFPIACFQVRHV